MKWLKSARVICTAAALVAVCASSLSCSNGSVRFPDPNLEEAIRDAIDKPTGTITQSDLKNLDYLIASNSNIADLTGIEHCTNLDTLWLGENYISDVSPLSSMTKLTYLSLLENSISDVSPLSSLTGLTELYLGDNQINDISALSTLINLETLVLYNNQIDDILDCTPRFGQAGLGGSGGQSFLLVR